jgi:ubiquinone/menaquinone biosynthesis C-methylase UbiE
LYNTHMLCELEVSKGVSEHSEKQISNIKTRYQVGKRFAEELLSKEHITWLDIGTNLGYGLPILNFDGKGTLLAIDLKSDYLKMAKEKNSSVETQVMDGCRLGLRNESIDAVSCFEVIEHVACQEASEMLYDIHRVLKPDGVLTLSTPNRGSSGQRRTSPDHKHEYTSEEMEGLFASSGFERIEQLGQSFIEEGSIFSKIFRGARDSYMASYIYYNVLPSSIRMKIRDRLQRQLKGDEIRKPVGNETPKNLFYVCKKI